MPGGLYEAGNVSYGIPYSGPVTTRTALLPHPLTSSAASLPTPYFTLRGTYEVPTRYE